MLDLLEEDSGIVTRSDDCNTGRLCAGVDFYLVFLLFLKRTNIGIFYDNRKGIVPIYAGSSLAEKNPRSPLCAYAQRLFVLIHCNDHPGILLF